MKQQIEFTTFGASSAFGGFEPGQKMLATEEQAAHLVDEAGCAKRVGELVADDVKLVTGDTNKKNAGSNAAKAIKQAEAAKTTAAKTTAKK